MRLLTRPLKLFLIPLHRMPQLSFFWSPNNSGCAGFAWIIGHDEDFMDGEMLEHGEHYAVVAHLGAEAEGLVGFDCMSAFVLQMRSSLIQRKTCKSSRRLRFKKKPLGYTPRGFLTSAQY